MSSVPDNFMLNVAKKNNPNDEYGIHFCKIAIPDITESDAEKKLEFFRNLFGKEYKVSMTHWICHGEVKENWK